MTAKLQELKLDRLFFNVIFIDRQTNIAVNCGLPWPGIWQCLEVIVPERSFPNPMNRR